MEPDFRKFGRGPRELTGAVDLISQYRLLPHYEFFCKRPLPASISDAHYLHNVVGDTEIRKGEEMELGQLIKDKPLTREIKTRIQPFDLDILREAFHLKEAAPVHLNPSEKGIPTIAGKSKSESKDKEKKHKAKDKEKDKDHKKHKHRHKDRSKDKDKEKKKDKNGRHDSSNEHSKRPHDKKRRHDGDEDANDINKHKRSKHKSSKIEEMGVIKVAG